MMGTENESVCRLNKLESRHLIVTDSRVELLKANMHARTASAYMCIQNASSFSNI